jgi:hypothetical protein
MVKGTNTMLVHLAAATCNREAEGLGVVGSAAATYSRGGAEITSHHWVIGTELTQFNADAYVLARVVEVLAHCFTVEVAPPHTIYYFVQVHLPCRQFRTCNPLRPTHLHFISTMCSLLSFILTGELIWYCAGLLRMMNQKGTG